MPDENCKTCGKKIETMSFRGTGYCSENCKDGNKRPTVVTSPVVKNINFPKRPIT